jgi:hypothetical protein
MTGGALRDGRSAARVGNATDAASIAETKVEKYFFMALNLDDQ